MITFEYIISDPIGLHIQPASELAKVVGKHKSVVSLTLNDMTADASKVLPVVSLGAVTGSKVIFNIEGEDELESYSHLVDFCNKRL